MNPVLREHLIEAAARYWHERHAQQRVSAMRLEMRQIQEQEEMRDNSTSENE